jgi:hypothetical protein
MGEIGREVAAIAYQQFWADDGLPLTEIVPGKTIAYTHRADFIPGVEPYIVGNKVDFFAVGGNARWGTFCECLSLDTIYVQ